MPEDFWMRFLPPLIGALVQGVGLSLVLAWTLRRAARDVREKVTRPQFAPPAAEPDR